MRKLLLMLLVVLFGGIQSVSAQMVKEGRQWSYVYSVTYRVHGNTVTAYTFYKYEFDGTIELNGKTYMKLYETELDEYGRGHSPEYVLGLREENGRVYANYEEYLKVAICIEPDANWFDPCAMPYTVTEDGEVLLYDFTLDTGDYFGATDISVKSYINGKTRMTLANDEECDVFSVWRLWYGGDEDEEYDESLWNARSSWDTVISGIGSQKSLINWLNTREIAYNGDIVREYLNVCVVGNELVYKNPHYVQDVFFDDLVTGIGRIKSDASRDVKPCLYDLSGRKVEGRPRPGVYIKDGRKVVVK